MSKPETVKDLFIGQHISLSDVEDLARAVFDGKTTAAGPEGYVVTAALYDDLPDHIRDFVRKAFMFFSVENVLDADEADDEPDYSERDELDEDPED